MKIEQYVEKKDVQKREQVIELMIEYDKKKNPTSLNDYLKSVSDNFSWSKGKYKVMLALSFILQDILGSLFYGWDVYTDIHPGNVPPE